MKWSENMKHPPVLLDAGDFNPRRRAYPFADYANDGSSGPPSPIEVTPVSVTFYGQRGPVKEGGGINGCQIDDMITFALGTLQTFNKKFPCRENSLAITKLEEALHWLDHRKRDRVDRRVEGYDKE